MQNAEQSNAGKGRLSRAPRRRSSRPPAVRACFTLTAGQDARLSRESERTGLARSELVRRLIDREYGEGPG